MSHRFRRGSTAALALAAIAAGAGGVLLASDHQDTAEVELNPTLDMTDFYAFPSPRPGRTVLVMNSRAFLTPGQTPSARFDENLLYQFKIDRTGDAVEDRVIQVTFTRDGSGQRVEVRGPVAPPVAGAMMNEVAEAAPVVSGPTRTVLGDADGVQVFAGPRDDPFFIDLEAAFCILPDRKPVTGPLAGPCALPGGAAFRPAGEAQNYVNGFNALSIVLELPTALLDGGTPGRLGLWATMSR